MADPRAEQSWGTSQLVEFLAVLARESDEAAAMRSAVERVLESLDAEVGALVGGDHGVEPDVVVGMRPDDKRLPGLIATAIGGAARTYVPDLGECRTAAVALHMGADSPRLVVARLGHEDFGPRDLLLLRGMAWVLDLARNQLRMVAALSERQRVLEHLSRVQRCIASRVPLPEVFDTVTDSALSLVGSELAILHLLDRDGLAVVSVSGVSTQLRPQPWSLRMSGRIADEVYRRDEMVRTGGAADRASRVAMGAPVRENGAVVGSLVVISPPGGRCFADSQEQALRTFADQVSVALSDAKTQVAAQHAVRDPVTGLPNRVLFLDQLESALAAGKRVHVLFLDLDRFKHVNDTLGHAVGDDLLRKVGRRLRESLRSGETLARFGGDEFAVLLENASDLAVRRCGERMLAAVAKPYLVGTEEVVVGCSIGVATGHGTMSPTEVLRDADTAMYRAKNSGGDRIVNFEERMRTVLMHRRSVESDLRQAVEAGSLRVVFQPIVGLRDRVLHAAEALVRWDHPTRGPVQPTDFIPLAEETGLIVPLGRHVLYTACTQAAAWSEVVEKGRGPSVAVNVSARQLHDPAFLTDIRQVLTDTRLDPSRLILEITESTMVSDLDAGLELMLRLRELGVRLAIDDFGTGYSSLSYLRMFPVEILKIDRSFIESIAAPWQGRAFVQAIVRLAHALSMTPVAEGVETPEQAQALLDVGCTMGQGFLLARPMPSADIITYACAHSKPSTHLGSMPDITFGHPR